MYLHCRKKYFSGKSNKKIIIKHIFFDVGLDLTHEL